MNRFLLCFCVLLLGVAPALFAQQIRMKAGKVLAGSEVYCLYSEGQEKNDDLLLHTQEGLSPGSDFKDIWFSNRTDSANVIAMEAKVLAHPRAAYLIYHYSIRFFPAGEVLNIRYRPLRSESFVKDLVKYRVFVNGSYNQAGALELIGHWRKKDDYLSDDWIASGVSTAYVQSGKEKVYDELVSNLSVLQGKIYRNDTLIARYHEGAPYNPGESAQGRKTYYVQTPEGLNLMVLTVPAARSVAFALMLPGKEKLELVTPDKSEEKLMRVAAGILILRRIL